MPPNNFHNQYSNNRNPPAHFVTGSEHRDSVPIDPSLLPNANVDTSFDRASILMNASLGEAVPAFLGLRKYMTERRIEKHQENLEELAVRQTVISHVGESILKGVGYLKPNDKHRPVTREERYAAKQLERVTEKRKIHRGHEFSILSANAEVEGTKQTYRPFFNHTNQRLTKLERMNVGRNARKYRKISGSAEHMDSTFANIIAQPAVESARVINARDSLVIHSDALDRATVIRDQKRAARKINRQIRIVSATTKLNDTAKKIRTRINR